MAKFSKKVMGKEVGQADVYAEPHSMSGGPMVKTKVQDPNTRAAKDMTPGTFGNMRVSAGDPANTVVNKNGEITMRGAGAATKGTKCRGPMG
jgi:hypothetical protein